MYTEGEVSKEIDRPLIFIAHSLGGLGVKKALVLASQTLLTQADDAHHIYNASKALMFFGTPNAGSAADKAKRVWLLKKIAKAVFTEVPPKLESALELHSDELLDLADDFRNMSLCVRRELPSIRFSPPANVTLSFVCVTRMIKCPDPGKLMIQDVETTPLRTYECTGWPTTESCCIWEAGLATMAYPPFFPPIKISGTSGAPGNTYFGSLFHSNPSFTALNEAKNLWNSKIADIGVLLSLGGAPTASRMYLPNNRGIYSMSSDLSSNSNTHASTAGAIERTHRHIEILFHEASISQEQACFHLDPGDALADVTLVGVPYKTIAFAIERIRSITANYLQNPNTYAAVKACAKALTEITRGEMIGLAMATGAAAKLTVEEHADLQQSLRLLRGSLGDEIVVTSSHQETLQRRLAIVEAAVLQLRPDVNVQSSLWREWRSGDTVG